MWIVVIRCPDTVQHCIVCVCVYFNHIHTVPRGSKTNSLSRAHASTMRIHVRASVRVCARDCDTCSIVISIDQKQHFHMPLMQHLLTGFRAAAGSASTNVSWFGSNTMSRNAWWLSSVSDSMAKSPTCE